MSDEREEHYRRILRECHPLITRYCDPDELVAPLSAQHLLTASEKYTLKNRLLPPLHRLNDLVEWLPRKGDDWFERFAAALASDKEGIISDTDGHVIVLKKMWEMAQEVGHPLPENLRIWSAPNHQPLGNHGDSLLDTQGSYSYHGAGGNYGDSLSLDTISTVEPIEEMNSPIQEQCGVPSPITPVTLDKISLLLLKALGADWGRIHAYCYHNSSHFTVAISNIKERFRDHPHMQILMTLKQLTRSLDDCSSQVLYYKIKPLLDQSSTEYQSQLKQLLFNECQHADSSPIMVERPQELLDRSQVDNISRKMFGQISPVELHRVALYYDISDDTMATLESQYGRSPITLLSNILIHWMERHHQATRHNFAIILNDLGISPHSIM